MRRGEAEEAEGFQDADRIHDAYVAAPSQKAALEAWGSDINLFARGTAEQVTDPELIKAPLERPGEVIKRLRGTEAEQVAALGGVKVAREKKKSAAPSKSGMAKAAPRPPKPSRTELDEAEERLGQAEKRQRRELREVDEQMEKLERRRREMLRRHEAEHDEASAERDRARSAYERAMRRWEKG